MVEQDIVFSRLLDQDDAMFCNTLTELIHQSCITNPNPFEGGDILKPVEKSVIELIVWLICTVFLMVEICYQTVSKCYGQLRGFHCWNT